MSLSPFVLPPAPPPELNPLQREILALKRDRGALLLAHNYQIPEIQQIADYVGDSLGLAYRARDAQNPVILFCGVHFMAETAKIVNPSRAVLIPDPDAGCSLADACDAADLARWKTENPGAFVVAYINCSAAVKALADVICTSGNAVKIVNKVPPEKEILFVPDQNLGQWVRQKTGRDMRLWPGSCYVHVLFTAAAIEDLRARFPGAPVVVHPECTQTVRDLADEVCSTELMIQFSRGHPSDKIIIITETGMLHRLRREIPGKTFIAGPTETCACNDCRFMKLNTLEKVRDALLRGSPEITLAPELVAAAAKPLQRMLDWSR
jgi:quinolinate synthase